MSLVLGSYKQMLHLQSVQQDIKKKTFENERKINITQMSC